MTYIVKTLIYIFLFVTLISCNNNSEHNENQTHMTAQDTSKWTPEQETPVLFVQIQPSAFNNEFNALEVRQKVEELIDQRLQLANIGTWFAGDIGPGGANMLFEVQTVADGMKIIITVLKEQKLDSNTIIGLRIYTAPDNWNYNVIYPENYTGTFNTM